MQATETPADAPSAEAFTERGDLLGSFDIDVLSDIGAHLRLRSGARLPDEFVLKIDVNRIFAARVRWRLTRSIGVYFPDRCAKKFKPEIDHRTLALLREIESLKRDLALHRAISSV